MHLRRPPRARTALVVAGIVSAVLAVTACDSANISAKKTRVEALHEQASTPADREWRAYLGDAASSQYSRLTQLTPDNVQQLQKAWEYDPGHRGLMPTNPLIVKGVLYGLDGHKNLFALNAVTGEELWVYRFDRNATAKGAGRGLVYWEGTGSEGEPLNYILVGLEHQLYAIDAISGNRVKAFGSDGSLDLRAGLDRPEREVNVAANTPGTLFGDLLIMGFATSEDYTATPGHIRAYRLPAGKLEWTFRTIPAAGEFGADTWPAENRDEHGGANAWAGMTVDEERGIVFVPTGSAGYDFYGANRAGDNLFANSLIALDARTGERLWHYQVVRHDLWDRDLPTPPNLITVKRDGISIPAVSQATKSGHLFVFHRETGEPLFPIAEVPLRGEGLPGEHLPDSQPLPIAPPPFTRQRYAPPKTPASGDLAESIAAMTINQPYPAPGRQGAVIMPGIDGGAEWGGQAWDPETGLLFVNANEVPWTITMQAVEKGTSGANSPETAYRLFCAHCHGADRRGMGDAFPSLIDIDKKYWPWEIWDIVRQGRGRMPGFAHQPWYYSLGAIVYLYQAGEDETATATHQTRDEAEAYGAQFQVLRDERNLPASKPPWGSLTAVDISAGRIAWRIPLGDYPHALDLGLTGYGAENYGGPVVTAGGLLFIAATPDNRIRAYNKRSGELLWEDRLPAAGFATPAVYEAGGKQFLVIAAGGGKLDQPTGSSYVAYALPD